MTESELDECYAELCRTLTLSGEERAAALLARFALLAMNEIADASRIFALIAGAADGMDNHSTVPS
jgi:hypothetical protein